MDCGKAVGKVEGRKALGLEGERQRMWQGRDRETGFWGSDSN